MNIAIRVSGKITSDNANEFKSIVEDKLATASEDLDTIDFSIDVENLEYISSAGLRVIMSLVKKVKSVSIDNASTDICDIFEVTGFNEVVNISKKLNRVSIDGLELIGVGATSKVYRLDKEMVIKVYNPDIPLATVKEEQRKTKSAVKLDIPTMISYDLVRVDNSYGVMFELFNGSTLVKLLADNPDKEDEYVREYAQFIKKSNAVAVSDKEIPSMKKIYYERIDDLEECGFYSKEQADTFRELMFLIPDTNSFLHGDCHPGNIMVDNGDFFFVDLATVAKGSPVFDVVGVAWYRLAGAVWSDDKVKELVGIEKSRLLTIWKKFLEYYFDTTDATTIERLDRMFYAFECFVLTSIHNDVPALFTNETEKWLIAEALKAVDFDWDIM